MKKSSTENTVLIFYIICGILLHKIIPTLSDLSISHTGADNDKIVFQTASDFVRTGCGTFLKNSFLVVSNPLSACKVPRSPPSVEDQWNGLEQNDWALLVSGFGECDLKTKFRNAADAGYTSIIVGTTGFNEEIVYPGLLADDDEEFIDAHLVNEPDLRALSNYSYPKDYVVIPPNENLLKCKDEYKKTWLRSRYISIAVRTLKKISRGVANFYEKAKDVGKWAFQKTNCYALPVLEITKKILYAFANVIATILVWLVTGVNRMPVQLSKDPEIQDISNILVVVCIAVLIAFQVWVECLSKRRTKSNSKDESNSESKNRHYEVPPSAPKLERVPIDYTLYHRINLEIKKNEPLTKAKVNSAYKQMALKYHPDKNTHLKEDDLRNLEEEFKSKAKSRDILINYCKY